MPNSSRRGLVVGLLLWAASYPIPVGGQDLTWRDRDNRFEGLKEVPNGKRDYEVLAFFGYDQVNTPSPDGNLHLMFYLPPGGHSQVNVKELHSDTQYEAEFKANKLKPYGENWWTATKWPIAEVIKPAHVDVRNLGVLIHVNDTPVPGEIAPAVLYTSQPPSQIRQYVLYFVSNRELRHLSCIVTQENLRKPCTVGEKGHESEQIETSEPTEITVDATGLQPGDAVVNLEGTLANTASNGSFSARIHFLHQSLPR